MARFLTSATIGALAQSTGGITALQAGPTGILRNKRPIARIRDFYAQANRNFFLQLLAIWQTALSDSDRIDWIALGGTQKVIDVFGNPVPLNGLGSFIRFNLPLLQAGLAANTTPPTDFTTTTLSTFTVTALAGPQTIKLTALTPNIDADEMLIIACSITLSPGYTSTKHRPRILARAQGPLTLPIDFSAKWLEQGGILQAGTALHARIKVLNQNSGMHGPSLSTILAVS